MKTKEELLKEKAEVGAELKKVHDITDLGSDIDSYDTEADEAEERSKNVAIQTALKERLAEIDSKLAALEKGE